MLVKKFLHKFLLLVCLLCKSNQNQQTRDMSMPCQLATKGRNTPQVSRLTFQRWPTGNRTQQHCPSARNECASPSLGGSGEQHRRPTQVEQRPTTLPDKLQQDSVLLSKWNHSQLQAQAHHWRIQQFPLPFTEMLISRRSQWVTHIQMLGQAPAMQRQHHLPIFNTSLTPGQLPASLPRAEGGAGVKAGAEGEQAVPTSAERCLLLGRLRQRQ